MQAKSRRCPECIEENKGTGLGLPRGGITDDSLRIKKELVGAWRFELQASCAQGKRQIAM
jgi:hypothetical protein